MKEKTGDRGMKEKRMFQAVTRPATVIRGYGYALLAVIVLLIIFQVGTFLGATVFSTLLFALPSQVMQFLFFTISPYIVTLLSFFFPAVLVCLWVLAVERRSAIGLGFFRKGAISSLFKGGLLGILLISLVVGMEYATGSVEFAQLNFSAENLLSFLLVLPFWFLQSGTEELLLRGWLFPVVARKTSLWIGILVSSLLFAAMHAGNASVGWISLVNIGLFGLFACLYVLKTDNIWGVAGLHATWNAFQGNVYGMSVSGVSPVYSLMEWKPSTAPDYLSGGGFGPEATIFTSIVLLSATAVLLGLMWKEKKTHKPFS